MVREICCGDAHTVVVMTSGEVCTFGEGEYGRLGHGDRESNNRPRVVPGIPSMLSESQLQAKLAAAAAIRSRRDALDKQRSEVSEAHQTANLELTQLDLARLSVCGISPK